MLFQVLSTFIGQISSALKSQARRTEMQVMMLHYLVAFFCILTIADAVLVYFVLAEPAYDFALHGMTLSVVTQLVLYFIFEYFKTHISSLRNLLRLEAVVGAAYVIFLAGISTVLVYMAAESQAPGAVFVPIFAIGFCLFPMAAFVACQVYACPFRKIS